MRANQIQPLVRSHHDELRRMLDELEPAVQQLLEGDERRLEETIDRTRVLHDRLCVYTSVEDALLVPYLRAARISHGAVLGHHRQQQRSLASALQSVLNRPCELDEFARSMRALIQVVREAMVQEQRDLLSARFLDQDESPRSVPGSVPRSIHGGAV